jgi:uncharacterized protein YbjT (DUF2867 family)
MILLAGATGALGMRVAEVLRERGEAVRALVRERTDASRLEALGAEIARGDLTDRASLEPACAGATTVISTATAMGRLLDGTGGPSIRDVDEVGTAQLIDAAEGAGVARFVFVSYAGVDAGIGFPLERAKLATEARLRSSAMRAVIVRPDAFQEIHLTATGQFDLRAGRVGILGGGDGEVRFVSTDDVAALVAAVTVEDDPPETIEFGGPEALSHNRAIEIAESALGHKLKRRRLPTPALRVATRLLAGRRPALASVFGLGLVLDGYPSRWDDGPLRERGIDPRPATEFIRAQAGESGAAPR